MRLSYTNDLILQCVPSVRLFIHRSPFVSVSSRPVKPKFHYADSPSTSPSLVADVADFPAYFPDANGLVANLSREFFKPSRQVAMV